MSRITSVVLCVSVLWLISSPAVAWDVSGVPLQAKHGAQGTGNYKGKRDRHEKPTPMHEKKRKSSKWVPEKK